MSCSCKKPADVFNNVCGVCLLPIKEMSLQSKYDDLKAKYEKCLLALNKIKNHDGHRHSEDPDDIAMFCLRELGEK